MKYFGGFSYFKIGLSFEADFCLFPGRSLPVWFSDSSLSSSLWLAGGEGGAGVLSGSLDGTWMSSMATMASTVLHISKHLMFYYQ